MAKDIFLSRRKFVAAVSSAIAFSHFSSPLFASPLTKPLMRKIPKSGEELPVIGMGTWRTFNVGRDEQTRIARAEVLAEFLKLGGQMIDSSPMYGSAEEVLGFALKHLNKGADDMFSATKVWTPFSAYGQTQIKNSKRLWGVNKIDLFQVHNLVSWESHLDKLFQMKADKNLKYVGITTSHGLRHGQIEKIMKSQPIDFVQFTYNILDREAEQRLLPIAAERKIAVIINRPFQGGQLFPRFENKKLPEWAKEFDCKNWAQFFLKFITSHPAVTCAIPATSKVAHMQENMGALQGRLPDKALRKRMVSYIENL